MGKSEKRGAKNMYRILIADDEGIMLEAFKGVNSRRSLGKMILWKLQKLGVW